MACSASDRLADLLGGLAELLRPLARGLDLAGELAELAAGLADLLADVGEVDVHLGRVDPVRYRDPQHCAVALDVAAQEQSAGYADRAGYGRDDDLRDGLLGLAAAL